MAEPEPRYQLDDFNDIPSFAEYPLPPLETSPFNENGDGPQHDSWQRVNLADPKYGVPPAPPELMGLLYAGKRHVISGPPESTKTLVAYILTLEAIRAGRSVAVIDFEMGAEAARRLLDELGATLDEIRSIYFVSPNEPPQDELRTIIDHGTWLAVIDAAIGAFDASGLDDNARKDVQRFARTWIDPLWKEGVASLLVDHVTKDAGTRGKFTIGSERKLGACDIHISLEAVKALTRGESGLVKVHVHKDRPGFLKRPTAATFELESHPQTHHITWKTRDPQPAEDRPFRPTHLMGKISAWLHLRDSKASRNEIIQEVSGKTDWKRVAIDALVRESYVQESPGKQSARMYESVKLYLEHEDPLLQDDENEAETPTSPPSPQPRPNLARGEVEETSPHLAPDRPYGAGEVGAVDGPAPDENEQTSPLAPPDDGIPF